MALKKNEVKRIMGKAGMWLLKMKMMVFNNDNKQINSRFTFMIPVNLLADTPIY